MPELFDEFISYTPEEFAALDLIGRPFLSEQGRTVTRGFITGFEYDAEEWHLHLRDVDYLNKKTRDWERKRSEDTYMSTHSYFNKVFSDDKRNSELHLAIGGYGMIVFVGPKGDNPWQSFAWADVLQTDCFEGGVLGEDRLP